MSRQFEQTADEYSKQRRTDSLTSYTCLSSVKRTGEGGSASFLHSRLVNSNEKGAAAVTDDVEEMQQAAELMSDLRRSAHTRGRYGGGLEGRSSSKPKS